jgi:HD-GYP domain-containing protein (c-di-GMP phosphodiesterase class II)
MGRIMNIISMRDVPTRNHQRRVSALSTEIGKQMDMSSGQIRALRAIGMMHDIGKVVFPPEFLVKTNDLSPTERQLVMTHPQVGFDMLDGLGFSEIIRQSILQHHEHIDGSGYPNGLKGDQILVEAKIVTVADVVDAMTSNRPYNTKLGINDAISEITKNSGRYYEPVIVETCLEVLNNRSKQQPSGYGAALQFEPPTIALSR